MSKKTLVALLWVLSPSIILRALGTDIFLPCLPSVAKTFNAPFASAQWVLTGYLISSGLGQFIMGPLADKYGRRKILIANTLLFIISSLACALAPALDFLIINRVLQGLGACGVTVVTVAIIRDLFDDESTPRMYSYFNSIIALVPIFAPILGGILLVWTGSWRPSFYGMLASGVLALVLSYLFVPESNPRFKAGFAAPKLQITKGYLEILTNKAFLSYMFCAITGFTGLFLFFAVSSILLITILNVSPDNFGYYFALNSTIFLIGNLLSPKLQSITSLNHAILIGNYLVLFGAALMFICDWQAGLTLTGLMLPNFILTLGVGLLFGPCMAGAVGPFKHIAGMASACYGALLYCTSGIIVTLVMQQDIKDAKPLALAMLVLGAVSLILIKWQFGNRIKQVIPETAV